MRSPAAGNDDGLTGFERNARCFQLGNHASATATVAAVRERENAVVDQRDFGQQSCTEFSRVAVIEAIHIGE